MKQGLDTLFNDRGIVADVVVMGSVFSIHFGVESVMTYRDLARSDKDKARSVFMSLLNQGFFLSQGMSMNAISLPTQGEHIDALVDAIGRAVEEAGIED